MPPEIYAKIVNTVEGTKRKQYAYALSVLDSAVGDIIEALGKAEMINSTYVIFVSDNGGCLLDGTKATLYE